jgi:hypothetical protein
MKIPAVDAAVEIRVRRPRLQPDRFWSLSEHHEKD